MNRLVLYVSLATQTYLRHHVRSKLRLAGLLLTFGPFVSFAASHGDESIQVESAFKGRVGVTTSDSVPDWIPPIRAPQGAPNVVIILLDDVGFGAASVFGGPVETPTLEQFAAQGLRYNRFHVTALCSPTRAALLSGRNDHRAGFGTLAEVSSGFPGYNGIWRKDTATVAEVLRRNGYSTAAFGKWHNTPPSEISPVGPFDRWPTGLGFEYFYGFMGPEDSQWEPSLYRDTTPVEPPLAPNEGYHLTTDLVDEAIRWVETHQVLAPDKPYFLYFATGATHEPHHVPKEWIAKYRGRFDEGWDKLRQKTFARQKKLGVIPDNAELTMRPKELPAWESFSADRRKFLARQMEVYAAFLAHTDHEVGRLLQTVQQGPEGNNTLILYLVGDNGAEGGGGLEGSDDLADWMTNVQPDPQKRLHHIDELGSKLYFNVYATGWGWSTNTPFKWTKDVGSHFGGTRDPLIVSWPARIKDRGSLRSQFTHVIDVAATIYEVTGIRFPSSVNGVSQQPLDGISFAYSFDNPTAPSRHRTQIFEQEGNRAIYQDGWVAAALHRVPWIQSHYAADFEKDRWELYHIDTDFSEAHDLADEFPQKLRELRALFDVEARANNVYPLGAGDKDWAMDKGPPSLMADKREIIYHVGMPRTTGTKVPDFARSHRITAEVVIPNGGAQGVLIAVGSRYCGFALYVKDSRLIYESHSGERRQVITSQVRLPPGHLQLTYDFVGEAGIPKRHPLLTSLGGVPGTGSLYVNHHIVAQAKVTAVSGWTLGIGQAFGSSISPVFSPPFKFTGLLKSVKVEFDPENGGQHEH